MTGAVKGGPNYDKYHTDKDNYDKYLLRSICRHNKSHDLPLVLGPRVTYIFPGRYYFDLAAAKAAAGAAAPLMPGKSHQHSGVAAVLSGLFSDGIACNW